VGRIAALARTCCALIALSALGATSDEIRTPEQIRDCTESNRPSETSIQTVSLQAKDRVGAINTSRAKLYWRKFDDGLSKVMMRFYAPPDLRGTGLLMLERDSARNDLFIYLPELGRVKRVTSRMTSSSMFGTDFSYEEFERIQGLTATTPVIRLDDDVVEGRPTWVIESRPTEESRSAYERIISFVDQGNCTILRTDFFERGQQARKTLTADPQSITHEEEGIWIVRRYLMQDLRDQTETALVIESVEIGADIGRKTFSQRELVSGGR
jgi:hypothetical protein